MHGEWSCRRTTNLIKTTIRKRQGGLVKSRLLIGLATSGVLLSLAAKINGGPVDMNGTAPPDPSDGKAVKLDNSKEKEVPPIEKGCVAPKDFELRIGLPGWLAGVSGDTGVKGVV